MSTINIAYPVVSLLQALGTGIGMGGAVMYTLNQSSGKNDSFYEDIQRMLIEQKAKGKIRFAITSKNQMYNSSDLLFPFDKFESKTMFADGTGELYRRCCRDNLNILFDFLDKMFEIFHMEQTEIYIVEGYDVVFRKKVCSMEEMKEDILWQAEYTQDINSGIYYVC